jgi:glycosyltransferase involved in cell wall biosynthesis
MAGVEYLVIDGESSDDSLSVIQQCAGTISWWRSEPDRGQADAINVGFARATGDILGWLNSDDRLLPSALEVVSQIFSLDARVQWIVGARLASETEGRVRECHTQWQYQWPWFVLGLPDFPQEATFFRRSVWEAAGGLDDTMHFHFDVKFFSQMLRQPGIGVFLRVPLAMMNVHAEQKTHASNRREAREAEARKLDQWYRANRRMGWMLRRAVRTRYGHIVIQSIRPFLAAAARRRFRIGEYDYMRKVWRLVPFQC